MNYSIEKTVLFLRKGDNVMKRKNNLTRLEKMEPRALKRHNLRRVFELLAKGNIYPDFNRVKA